MRNLVASLLLATLVLAYGYWNAGDKLHHLFGAIFVALVAGIVLPMVIFKHLWGKIASRERRRW